MKIQTFKRITQANGLISALQPLPLKFIAPPTLYQRGLRLFGVKPQPIVVTKHEQLRSLIEENIRIYGETCDLNHIDVSQITDMNHMFSCLPFNGDISRWNVSNVTDMQAMFEHSPFQGDISQWNVSKVDSMRSMFDGSLFDGDISNWNVSHVTYMDKMFRSSEFNGDISRWNTSNVRTMSHMFAESKFNRTISNWDVSRCENMLSMFDSSEFQGDISRWNVSKVEDMRRLFEKTQYKRDISSWTINAQCHIDHAAPDCYGNSPLFLACALAKGQHTAPIGIPYSLRPAYEQAYAMAESLGIQGIEAGYAMFQMINGTYQPAIPSCELNDFS